MWKIGNVEINNKVVLAPLAGVSDKSYRTIVKEMGVGLIYTEMVSAIGLNYDSKKTKELLDFDETERPISVQLFGSEPGDLSKAAKYVEKEIKPDIIDINMGCPVSKVAVKSKSGSALLKDPEKIGKIIKEVTNVVSIPVTIKIRSGWDKESINCVEIAKIAENSGASAIAIHPRTRTEGYTGKANWDLIKEIKENVSIPVIGNGDIKTIEDAKNMLDYTKCDAIMIGRGALGNPWFIKEVVEYIEKGNIIEKPTREEKLNMIIKHYELLKKDKGQKLALLQIKTHALWYVKGLKDNKEIKNKIVSISSEEELYNIINDYK